MAKILILYASVGKGHKTAANALKEAFEDLADNEVIVEDILDYALPVFKSIYADSYLDLMEKAPDFMSLLYKLSDKANSEFAKEFVSFYSRLGMPRFKGVGKGTPPDAIIFTHHLGMHLIESITAKHKKTKVYSVITDYTTTAMEANQQISRYFVATDIVADRLVGRGISRKNITVTGIPVKKEIAQSKDQANIREQLGITKTPVVSIFGAGIKDSKIRDILLELQKSFSGTVLVVAGRNIMLEEKIEDIASTKTVDIKKYKQIHFVDDVIVASDLVVTKAGGLIISETLARRKPLLFINGIRGQEEWNADYVCMEGAAIQMHTPELMSVAICSICSDEKRRAYMQGIALKLGKPDAAGKVAELISKDISANASQ